tara:strand:+ start:134 stop:346 length:213 start_codon:yes stop_codon:yes gene_type:complete
MLLIKTKKNKFDLKTKILKKLQIIIVKKLLIKLSGKIHNSKKNNIDKFTIEIIKNAKFFENFILTNVLKI